MPLNRFPNATEDELVFMLESLQRRATTGEVYMTTYSGDQNMKGLQGAPTVDVAMKWVLFALFLLNPTRFPNPHKARSRRLAARY